MILLMTLGATAQVVPVISGSCSEKAYECEEVLKKADDFIKAQKTLIQNQDTEIQARIKLDAAKDKYIGDLESENKSWYRNPYITIPLGILTGIVIAHELK